VTQAAIAEAYIDAGLAAIVIDPKGDPHLRGTLEAAARRSGATFRAWTPTGPYVYNPLARGGPTEIVDKALAAHRWSEPHYELATQRLLGHVLTTMQLAGQWPPTISGVVENMNPERLDDLASHASPLTWMASPPARPRTSVAVATASRSSPRASSAPGSTRP
jgi:hypothetical protein